MERLSSGKRINSARDDIVGLSQVTNLSAQIRGLRQANLNINQGVGLLQTADSAISVQLDILQRMRELAVQGANGVLSASDRDGLTQQLLSLRDEFQRITSQTEFNGIKLLNGSNSNLEIQTGTESGASLSIDQSDLRTSEVFEKPSPLGNFQFESSIGNINGFVMHMGDIDGDGDDDLVTANSGSDFFEVLLSNGDGTFDYAQSFDAGFDLVSSLIEMGDLNADGKADFISIDTSNDQVYVLMSLGEGQFDEPATIDLEQGDVGGAFALIDFDRDDDLDLVSSDNSGTDLYYYENDGDGNFSFAESAASPGVQIGYLRTTDIDGDGFEDLIAHTEDTNQYSGFILDGSDSFNSGFDYSTAGTEEFGNTFFGDIDGDGYADLIAEDGDSGTTQVLYGDGDGSFSGQTTFTDIALGSPSLYRGFDFDQDGDLDIISADTGSVQLNINDGSGNFSARAIEDAGASSSNSLVLGDFNGDASQDFAFFDSLVDDAIYSYLQDTELVSAVSNLDLSSVDNSSQSLEIIDRAINTVIESRSSLANSLERLEIRAEQNLLYSENLQQARSNIQDTDVAQETAELVRQQILQQAQIATLSQANTNAQLVVGLFDL